MRATPWCQKRMCDRRKVRRRIASSPECRHDIARPRSKALHSLGPSSAWVPASTPWTRCRGLACPSGGPAREGLTPAVLSSPDCASALCAGNRRGSAKGCAPGGGRGAEGAGAHGRVLALAPLLRRDPAGSSRASAAASSGLSGAGAPGRSVVVGSTLAGTRAPFGWRPSSYRDRVSIALHSPGMRVCDVWLLSRWFLQAGHSHTISCTPAALHSPGTRVCSGSV